MSRLANYHDLAGKAALITGGASGIGEALVHAFCAQGARVAFIDLDKDAGSALAARTGAAFAAADLRDIEALRRAIEALRAEVGPFSALVNNAARDDRHEIDDVTPEYWRERMATNLDHQFFAAQAVHRDMADLGGGSIICMGSGSYLSSPDSFAAYKTAKSAAVGLMRALARELGPKNIRVNCLIPGWIMTERQKNLWLNPQSEAELLKAQCLKRPLTPAEIANCALFLASDASSAMTAQTMIADGGWS